MLYKLAAAAVGVYHQCSRDRSCVVKIPSTGQYRAQIEPCNIFGDFDYSFPLNNYGDDDVSLDSLGVATLGIINPGPSVDSLYICEILNDGTLKFHDILRFTANVDSTRQNSLSLSDCSPGADPCVFLLPSQIDSTIVIPSDKDCAQPDTYWDVESLLGITSDNYPSTSPSASCTAGSVASSCLHSLDLNKITDFTHRVEISLRVCGCIFRPATTPHYVESYVRRILLTGDLHNTCLSNNEFTHDLGIIKVSNAPLFASESNSYDAWKAETPIQLPRIPIISHIFKKKGERLLQDTLPDASRWSGSTYSSGGGLCVHHTDCINEFGKCENNKCRGFIPDLYDERSINCVDGYRCRSKEGEITGIGVGKDFQIIAIPVTEKCGAVDPLKSTESVFGNSNRWECEESGDTLTSNNCIFTPGVGKRLNRVAYKESVRLCGCPAIDSDVDGVPCNTRRDYFVPLAILTVQECLRNSHCIDHQFAYCVDDHCAAPSGIAASAGLRVFQCVTSRNCDIQGLSSKALTEGLKVLPITSSYDCAAETALDPEFIQDSALPCIIDINNDGECEVNLGLARALGTTRLCGCGGDRGGNGRDCDELEDFNQDLGLVVVAECIIDNDCGISEMCIDGSCHEDTLPPYVIRSFPGNNSFAVPPIAQLTLTWNENIKFNKAGRKLVIACATCEDNKKWEIVIKDPTTYRVAQAGYSQSIRNRELYVTPDVSASSLPEGKYFLGYEGGIVSDLQDNFNSGNVDISFTISKNAGCPYLYITGFSPHDANINGLYTPIDPINKHVAWKGGSSQPLYLFWKDADAKKDQPGNWIVSTKADDKQFIAYADLTLMSSLDRDGDIRPPSGSYKQWLNDRWEKHPNVTISCRATVDRSFPKLTEISPKIGETGVPVNLTKVVMGFSKPVTYGHWGNITVASTSSDHTLVFDPDFEAGMRGINIIATPEGMIELDVHSLGGLRAGEKYQVMADIGSLTDLSYNPWGPVERDVLFFTSYGVDCTGYPELDKSLKFLSQIPGSLSSKHGISYEVACNDGYGSPSSSTSLERSTLSCNDGIWKHVDSSFTCSANCEAQDFGAAYEVNVTKQSYMHGDAIEVSCSENSFVVSGSGKTTISCSNGVWSRMALTCGATCGPFLSLGTNYAINSDPNDPLAGTSMIGARRVVTCAQNSLLHQGIPPSEFQCRDAGWTLTNSDEMIECHVPCAELPKYGAGYIVDGTGLRHGTLRGLKCADNYSGYQGANLSNGTSITCHEGVWDQNEDFYCNEGCGNLNRGDGYDVVHNSGSHFGVHLSTIKVSCKPGAQQESGPLFEELVCNNGKWSLGTIVCNANCLHPNVVLGRSYVSKLSDATMNLTSFPHGTRATLYCSTDSNIMAGMPPDNIICVNGFWLSVVNEAGSISKKPKLVCVSGCGSFTKDNARYMDAGGEVRLSNREYLVPNGSKGYIGCKDGYSSVNPLQTIGEAVCEDGTWTENFLCVPKCNSYSISSLHQYGYLMDSTPITMSHGLTFPLSCRQPYASLLPNAATPPNLATCHSGRLLRPNNLICIDPNHHDGIRNLDEEEVDCGGASSLPCLKCSNNQLCDKTCYDGVKNGDETDIDCGGSKCSSPCQYCSGLPPVNLDGKRLTIDFGASFFSTSTAAASLYPYGTKLIILCDPPSQPSSLHSSSANGFQVYGCGPNNQWTLVDSTSRYALTCVLPTCTDGILNGDEFEIDCGGGCPPCPTCNDKIKNGDEIEVDCGGSRCEPCANCGVQLFRSLVRDSVHVYHNEVELLDLSDMIGSGHGDKRTISCVSSKAAENEKIELQCINGLWRSSRGDGGRAIDSLACDGVVYDATNGSSNYQFKTLLPISLSGCTDLSESSCCKLPQDFSGTLSGECGVVLYSSSNSRIASYCAGVCHTRLEDILGNYGARKGQGCDVLYPIYREIADLYCSTGETPNTKVADFHCFAYAETALMYVKTLEGMRDSYLLESCKANSCFAQSIRYFDLTSQLISLDTAGGKRLLRELDPKDIYSDKVNQLALIRQNAVSLLSSTPLPYFQEYDRKRKLQSDGRFYESSGSSPLTQGLLYSRRNVNKLNEFFSLVCLTDSENKPCTSVVRSLIQDPGYVQDDVCKNHCMATVFRHIGQLLYHEGIEELHPQKTSLGVLMRSHSFANCQTNSAGLNCGDLFGTGDLKAPFINRVEMSSLAEKTRLFPFCSCPLNYLGDGTCDNECNVKLCGYDQNDCLMSNVLPEHYQQLTSIVPLQDNCHTLNKDFACPTCKSSLLHLMSNDGCCIAGRVDSLREVLQHDIHLRNAIDGGYVDSYDNLELNRCSRWTEQTCQVSLDRTCSRGLRRPVIELKITLDDFDCFASFSKDAIVNIVTEAVRTALSDALAIPIFLITEIRVWHSGLDVEAIIDPGLYLSELLQELNKSIEELRIQSLILGEIMKAIQKKPATKRLLQQSEKELLKISTITAKLANVQSNGFSSSVGSLMPSAGTLDMMEYSNTLRNPSCPDQLDMIPPPGFKGDTNLVYVVDPAFGRAVIHGATRQVKCGTGYAPSLISSGPSPQYIVCDRGRWISSKVGEKMLQCRKPCDPFVLRSTGISVFTKDGSSLDGAEVKLTCDPGYVSTDNTVIETLKCNNGAWEVQTLECARMDIQSQELLSASCGIPLRNVILPVSVFTLRQILSGTIDMTNPPNSRVKNLTKLVLWSLRCLRGFAPTVGVEPLMILCVNETLYSMVASADSSWERYTSDKNLDDVAAIYHAANPRNSQELYIGNPLSHLQCNVDVRVPEWLPPKQPGLSTGAFYSIIFGGGIAGIATLLFIFFLYRTKCLKISFFSGSHEDRDNDGEDGGPEGSTQGSSDGLSPASSKYKTTEAWAKEGDDEEEESNSSPVSPQYPQNNKGALSSGGEVYSDVLYDVSSSNSPASQTNEVSYYSEIELNYKEFRTHLKKNPSDNLIKQLRKIKVAD